MQKNFLLLIVLAMTVPPHAAAADPCAPLDALMRSFVEEHAAVGAALAVARNGQVVYAKGFGMADREAQQPATGDSLFRIASISKPITSAAVLLLIRDGKLELDDRVVSLLPLECDDERWKQVTVRRLLWHAGGWDRDASFDPMFRAVKFARALDREPPATSQDVIDNMQRQPLDFDPGQQYAYSNFGYCLLGRIIEAQSGQTYEAFVKQRVLAPLGIKQMRIGRTLLSHRAEDEVRYYADEGQELASSVFPPVGEKVPSQYGGWHLEAMDSHGAWIGSAREVCQFGAKLHQLLTKKELAEVVARPPQPLWSEPDQQDHYYGLGWLVRPKTGDRKTPIPGMSCNTWHTGSLPGTSTLLVRRWDGLSWAVLFNRRRSEADTDDAGKHMARVIDPLIHQAVDQVTRWPTP